MRETVDTPSALQAPPRVVWRHPAARHSLAIAMLSALFLVMSSTATAGSDSDSDERPNVVIIITDDQGWGDRGRGGNPDLGQDFSHPILELIQDYNDNPANSAMPEVSFTPNLDLLRDQAVTMTDLHVTPMCATTRAQLMTGRSTGRTNVLFPVTMRSVMDPGEVTIAELLKGAGYKTGMFGKWNLGSSYPSRPQDQGFDRVLFEASGGNSATSNAWDNDCFGDTFINEDGEPVKTDESVYCGDVPFDEGIAFITEHAEEDEPFFAYIATPDAHWLRRVGTQVEQTFLVPPNASIQQLIGYAPQNPSLPSGGIDPVLANFLSQASNADKGIGAVRQALKDLGIEDNTILIVHGDNGSDIQVEFGPNGVDPTVPEFAHYASDGGIAGGKFETRDAGHRTFFHVHYPNGEITCEDNTQNGKSCFNDTLSSIDDVLPTIMELTGVGIPGDLELDGKSQVQALLGNRTSDDERMVFQSVQFFVGPTAFQTPVRYGKLSVRTEDYVLVHQPAYPPGFGIPLFNFALFDIKNDLAQEFDLSAALPQVVYELTAAYDDWFDSWVGRYPTPVPFVAGNEAQNPLTFNSDTVYGLSGFPAWHFQRATADTGVSVIVPNVLRVDESGTYKITVARWPFLGSGPNEEERCPAAPLSLGCPIDPRGDGSARLVISPVESDARSLTLSGAGENFIDVTGTIPAGASEVSFYVDLSEDDGANPIYVVSTLTGVRESTAGCDVTDPAVVNDPALCPVADGRISYHSKIELVDDDSDSDSDSDSD